MGRHSTKRGVLVYMPAELHRWLKVRAAALGTTLSAVVETAARRAFPDAPGASHNAGVAESSPPYGAQRGRRPESREAP